MQTCSPIALPLIVLHDSLLRPDAVPAPTAASRAAAAHKAALLQLWRGDVGAALATVTRAGALTADFVAAAASAGPRAWAAASRAYASHLESQGGRTAWKAPPCYLLVAESSLSPPMVTGALGEGLSDGSSPHDR